jgi:mono/diheme cytochrome c family protein
LKSSKVGFRRWMSGIALAACGTFALQESLQAQSDTKPTPPFFTAAQAKSGGVLYHQQCADCHADDLSGGSGPALKGDGFWKSWDQKPARSFYSRILTSMPAGDPGSLSEKQVLLIVAFIMEGNGFQAGETLLESAKQLDSIMLVRVK